MGGFFDCSELPAIVRRFESPLEFLTEGLWEDFLNRNVVLLAEHNRQARIDIVLKTGQHLIQDTLIGKEG